MIFLMSETMLVSPSTNYPGGNLRLNNGTYCVSPTIWIYRENADIRAGFLTLEEVFKQPKDAQDQLVVSQVVFMVRNEIRTLQGKISGLQGALEKKTSLQDAENVKFADALKGLYNIARSLDTVAMTVRLRISQRV